MPEEKPLPLGLCRGRDATHIQKPLARVWAGHREPVTPTHAILCRRLKKQELTGMLLCVGMRKCPGCTFPEKTSQSNMGSSIPFMSEQRNAKILASHTWSACACLCVRAHVRVSACARVCKCPEKVRVI